MQDSDDDLQDLDRLIGHMKADYQAMRHDGVLAEAPTPHQAPRKVAFYAVAAAAAVLLIAIIGTNLPGPQTPQSFAKLTLPDRGALPLSLRPVGKVKPLKLTVSLRVPRRPIAKKG